MNLGYGFLLFVFAVALLSNPTAGEDWFWELGNGFGFAAFAAILYLTTDGRNKKDGKGGRTKTHRWLGYGVVAALIIHTFCFLIGDPIVIEYLKFGAPLHMPLGWLALALCLILVISSIALYRKKSYANHAAFQLWHRHLSLLLIIASVLHIVLSGFYFKNILQWLLVTAAVIFIYYIPRQNFKITTVINPLKFLLVTVLTLGLFTLIRSGLP